MLTVTGIIESYNKGERDFSNVQVSGGNFTSLNLRGAVFKGADLSNSDFSHSDLTDADFSFATLTRCHFVGAILKNTLFDNADMRWSVLRNVYMDRTSLRFCNLEWAHLCRNDITQADISNASLSWSCLIDSAITESQKDVLADTTLTTIGSVSIGKDAVYKLPESQAVSGYKTVTTQDVIANVYTLKSASDKKDKKEYC